MNAAARFGVAALCALCALCTAACGYPDFAFDGDGATSDSAVGVDSGLGDDVTTDAPADTSIDTRPAPDAAADARVDAADTHVADTATATDTNDGASSVDGSVDSSVDGSADTTDALAACAMIDDMEDGDGYILLHCGRSGTWYTYNDGTAGATQTPAPGALATPSSIPGSRGSSLYAQHTYGGTFTSWGAGIGANFIDGGPSYDASAFGGVQFWGRSASGATAYVRFAMADVDTDARGGICSASGSGCGDHFGTNLTFDATWALYTINFKDMTQQGWGYLVSTGFAPGKVYGVQWQIAGGAAFDVWVDDVTFF